MAPKKTSKKKTTTKAAAAAAGTDATVDTIITDSATTTIDTTTAAAAAAADAIDQQAKVTAFLSTIPPPPVEAVPEDRMKLLQAIGTNILNEVATVTARLKEHSVVSGAAPLKSKNEPNAQLISKEMGIPIEEARAVLSANSMQVKQALKALVHQ
ncbi:hypothetical protein GQ42DRAFT_161567 [Ramicandelaber brevisporus]|nr:hypothetical protein GQ42DRAFT_161567 [Ramicandelaber brevisporus]